MHQAIHEDTKDVAVLVTEVLALAVDVVRPKDHVVEAEELVARLQLQLDGALRDPVRILGQRGQVLTHGQLVRPVDRDRRGERKTLDIVVDAGVDQVDAAHQVVGVVEPLDEVAQSFRRVGGQMVDVVEAVRIEQAGHEPVIDDRALYESGSWVDVFLKAARQVIEHDDVETKLVDQVVDDVRADEARPSGNECGCHSRFLQTIDGGSPRRRRGTTSKSSPAMSSRNPGISTLAGGTARVSPVNARRGGDADGTGLAVAAETCVAG